MQVVGVAGVQGRPHRPAPLASVTQRGVTAGSHDALNALPHGPLSPDRLKQTRPAARFWQLPVAPGTVVQASPAVVQVLKHADAGAGPAP